MMSLDLLCSYRWSQRLAASCTKCCELWRQVCVHNLFSHVVMSSSASAHMQASDLQEYAGAYAAAYAEQLCPGGVLASIGDSCGAALERSPTPAVRYDDAHAADRQSVWAVQRKAEDYLRCGSDLLVELRDSLREAQWSALREQQKCETARMQRSDAAAADENAETAQAVLEVVGWEALDRVPRLGPGKNEKSVQGYLKHDMSACAPPCPRDLGVTLGAMTTSCCGQ